MLLLTVLVKDEHGWTLHPERVEPCGPGWFINDNIDSRSLDWLASDHVQVIKQTDLQAAFAPKSPTPMVPLARRGPPNFSPALRKGGFLKCVD